MKLTIAWCLVMMAIPLRLCAQQVTIAGHVIDALTGSPLAKTNIYTTNKKGCTSCKDGSYCCSVDAHREITISYSYSGYKTAHITFVAKRDTTIDIALNPATYDLNTFIVTGVQRQRLLQDSPVPIQVISSQEIETMAYSKVTDVLSSSIPGLAIQKDNMGTSITIDGLSSKYVLILIDGQRIAGETDGNIDFERLNTLNIDRLEIIKGSGSLLYGSNAISGVVNIITKTAQKDGTNISITSRYGSFNTYHIGGISQIKKGRWESTTDAQYKHTDGYNKAPLIVQKQYNDININQKLNYTANKRLKIDGKVGYYRHQCKNNTLPRYPIYSDVNESLAATYKWHNGSTLQIEHAADKYTTTQHVVLSGNDIKEYQNTLIANRLIYNNAITKQHSLQAGIERLKDHLYSANIADHSKQQISTSLFVSDAYTHNDKLSLVASGRYVHGSTFGSTFVPGLSVMYTLGNLNIRSNYAMGYRSPKLKELYMDFDHLGWFTMVGNPDLKPELSHYTSISTAYNKPCFSASLSLYRNLLTNKIQETSPFDSSLVSYYNVDKVRIWGSNIQFKARIIRRIKISGGLALQQPINQSTGQQLENTYKVSGNMRLELSHPLGKGKIGCALVGLAYSSTTRWGLDNDGSIIYGKSPSYQMYDASIYYKIDTRCSLTGGVKNIFDYTDYVQKSSYSPGRSISLSINYHFNK